MKQKKIFFGFVTILISFAFFDYVPAQDTGSVAGRVFNEQGAAVHHATVLLVQTGQTAETDHEGRFMISGIPPGVYDLFAEAANFTSQAKLVTVTGGETVEIEMLVALSPIRETVTVTARGRHETTFQSVQSVNSLDTFDIAEKMAPSIGEVLEGELGVAKRSFGPGSARPVIRGFDGNRVLVLQDGMRTGSLGSQSGDHGESIDPGNLERLEVVKGPATLLYGSNAIGGVVNAVTRHHETHKHRHEGLRGQITSGLGSNNGLAGGNTGIEYGRGSWMFWGGGGGQRTGDYRSAEGIVENSKSRVANGKFGLGWFGETYYLTGGFGMMDGRYGIPFAGLLHEHGHNEEETGGSGEEDHPESEVDAVDVSWKSHNLRLTTGVLNLDSFIDNIRFAFNYTHWQHDELEILPGGFEQVGTAFDNRQFTYRGDFDHSSGPLTGTFGIWGTSRDYRAEGEEALSPPVDQQDVAVFSLEEVHFERFKFQFGARLEHMRYKPEGPAVGPHSHTSADGSGSPFENRDGPLPERSFTGFSGSAGLRVGLCSGRTGRSSHISPAPTGRPPWRNSITTALTWAISLMRSEIPI